MAEFREDTGAYPAMIQLAACAQQELVKRGLTPIDKVTVQPGISLVHDYVGNGQDCGEIIVGMNTAYATDPFPEPARDGTCATELAYELTVGIFRCAAPMHGTSQKPKPPTPAEQLNSMREHTADMAAMHAAIHCCMKKLGRSYAIRAWSPYGPNGNVVGGTWTVIVGDPED